MPTGVIIDTSFLITLANPLRPHHATARDYWRYFAEHNVPRFLPTIVVSEFRIKQVIPPEILQACIVLPFNWADAISAATLDFTKAARTGSRDALKDDVKIIAQAIVKEAAWIITDDADSLYRFAKELRDAGRSTVRPLKLEDGFEESSFEPQKKLFECPAAPEPPADAD